MFKSSYSFIGLLLVLVITSICSAQEYHFVSINGLIEQEVGRIIIPEIYKKLNIKVKISPMPGKRAQEEATSGRRDGEIMRIWTYGEENPTTIRVPTSYYYLETMAFIKKNSGIKIESKEDLRKYRLVKVRGVKHTNNITEGIPNVFDIDTTKRMLMFIQAGRADVALTNTVDGILILKELGIKNIVPIDKSLAILELYHYIHKDHKDLVPKVDAVIKEMKANGELKTLTIKAEKKVLASHSNQ
jgi:polar amino acid transport system substrate-binding protein